MVAFELFNSLIAFLFCFCVSYYVIDFNSEYSWSRVTSVILRIRVHFVL